MNHRGCTLLTKWRVFFSLSVAMDLNRCRIEGWKHLLASKICCYGSWLFESLGEDQHIQETSKQFLYCPCEGGADNCAWRSFCLCSSPAKEIMWGHPKYYNSWRASLTLPRSFRQRSGSPTRHSEPECWWKCVTFRKVFARDPGCPEREVQSWTRPLRERWSTGKSL